MSKVTHYQINTQAFKAKGGKSSKQKLSILFWLKMEERRGNLRDVNGTLNDFYLANQELIYKCAHELVTDLGIEEIIKHYLCRYPLYWEYYLQYKSPGAPLSLSDFWYGINMVAWSLHFQRNTKNALLEHNFARSEADGQEFVPIVL